MRRTQLRRLFRSLDNGAWGDEAVGDGSDVPCIRAADFDFVRLRANLASAPMRQLEPARRRRLLLTRGDLVLEKSGGGEKQVVGRAVLYDDDAEAVCSNFAARVRPQPGVDPRYLTYLLAALYYNGATATCVLQTTGIQNLDTDAWLQSEVPVIDLEHQRRIADFLDDQVARIDQIITARGQQAELLDEAGADAARQTVEAPEIAPRKPSGQRWLRSIPTDWPMTTVHAAYEVMLGKMLDESRFTGRYPIPYLRNTNVQWDRITTDDLKVMDIEPRERERFAVRRGDLLICEGGQPGRSAVWDGSIPEIAYQKALHRARPRGDNDVRWLQAFLRVAVKMSVFSAEFGQATIGHLTGEQLRSLRLPMPPAAVQRARADELSAELNRVHDGQRLLGESVLRLQEFKRSLISAAVTGEFDVSSADGSRVPA